MIDAGFLNDSNQSLKQELDEDFARLGDKLIKCGIDIDAVCDAAVALEVAVPTWGVGTGGTRFARFPGPGEPRGIEEKLEDCSVIQSLVRICPRVSPHFPWDHVADMAGLSAHARELDLGFDAVNSNTFQDQPGQPRSYKFGSLTHVDKAIRDQAVAHNIGCIEAGRTLGSQALTVWIADGSNFPGQQDFTGALERYLDSMAQIYAALPDDWHLFIEHKLFEPAFYSTVIADWGTSILCAQSLGDKAKCLVDLGHHAPTTNVEMIVARLAQFGKLGGFHFNDSKYGDDDLDSGAIDPFRLFLVFNELAIIEQRTSKDFAPAYMMDQSHNITDPIESLVTSADAIAQAFVQAQLVDRNRLAKQQGSNDALGAAQTLKDAFRTDVRPITAMARWKAGGAIDPISAYRASGYRKRMAEARPQSQASGGGIV